MRRLIKILVIFILLILVAIVAIPFVVPMDTLKNQAIVKIEALTGRKVSMGKVKLSVFPNIALSASDVSIGNPDWVKEKGTMAEVKTLRIGVELMPLLQKDIHVTDLALESPTIHLIKQGAQANWQFTPTAGAPAAPKNAEAEVSPAEKKRIAAPLRLDSLSISNGNLTLSDSASGTKTFSDVNVKLDSKNLPKSVSFKGSGNYNGTKTDINMTLGSPLDISIGAPAEIDLKASYGPNSVAWKGSFALKGGVPSVTGAFSIPEIDTTSLGSKSTVGGSAAAKAPPAPNSERWSSAPIDMSALNAANADIAVEIDKLILTQMTLTHVKAHVKLQNGQLQASLDELPLFGGTSKMSLTASHTNAVGINAELKNINMEEMMTTLAKSKAFTGTLTSGTVALTAQGGSQRAMVSNLNGTAGFALKDGTFRGGNLLNMTKNIATSFQGGQSKGETTDFSSLGGTFVAKNGIFSNSDLKMVGPLLQLSGTGTIDLPEWQVHYLLTPQVMTSQGSATTAASGISVPVQVEGSLDAPSYHPDLRGAVTDALKDPAKLKENLKNIRGNLNKDSLKNINSDTLKGLLGR